jgi:hypothetical protein
MATQAREVMDAEELTVIADAGYFKSDEILSCHEARITANVPKSATSDKRAKGMLGRRDFRYLPETDEYRCPANERLIRRYTTEENGLTVQRYWSSNCQACARLQSEACHEHPGHQAANPGDTGIEPVFAAQNRRTHASVCLHSGDFWTSSHSSAKQILITTGQMALRMSVDALLTTTDSDFLVFTQSGPRVVVRANEKKTASRPPIGGVW